MNIQSVIFLTVFYSIVTITPAVSQQQNSTELPKSRRDLSNGTTVSQQDNNPVIMKINVDTKQSVVTKIYKSMMSPLRNLIAAPKVNSVMRNIATCVVNGAVEIISYYFPAPLIPIIASVAGMMVPFEPVLMLRDKVPVTSYRRAFMTALNSFLGTFDRYRLNDVREEYDPYMMKRFNRRMMNQGSREKGTLTPLETTSAPTETQKGNKGDFIYSLNHLFKTLNRLGQQESDEESTNRKDGNYPITGNN